MTESEGIETKGLDTFCTFKKGIIIVGGWQVRD